MFARQHRAVATNLYVLWRKTGSALTDFNLDLLWHRLQARPLGKLYSVPSISCLRPKTITQVGGEEYLEAAHMIANSF